jgi:hypothetical protein
MAIVAGSMDRVCGFRIKSHNIVDLILWLDRRVDLFWPDKLNCCKHYDDGDQNASPSYSHCDSLKHSKLAG